MPPRPGPQDAWRHVHLWFRGLVDDIQDRFVDEDLTVFIDCNPSFSIYTTMALAASDRLIIPFSADGSSKRAVKSVISLAYGKLEVIVLPVQGQLQNITVILQPDRMQVPKIYMYVGNREAGTWNSAPQVTASHWAASIRNGELSSARNRDIQAVQFSSIESS